MMMIILWCYRRYETFRADERNEEPETHKFNSEKKGKQRTVPPLARAAIMVGTNYFTIGYTTLQPIVNLESTCVTIMIIFF